MRTPHADRPWMAERRVRRSAVELFGDAVDPTPTEPDPTGTLARFDNGPTSVEMDTDAWRIRHRRRG